MLQLLILGLSRVLKFLIMAGYKTLVPYNLTSAVGLAELLSRLTFLILLLLLNIFLRRVSRGSSSRVVRQIRVQECFALFSVHQFFEPSLLLLLLWLSKWLHSGAILCVKRTHFVFIFLRSLDLLPPSPKRTIQIMGRALVYYQIRVTKLHSLLRLLESE